MNAESILEAITKPVRMPTNDQLAEEVLGIITAQHRPQTITVNIVEVSPEGGGLRFQLH